MSVPAGALTRIVLVARDDAGNAPATSNPIIITPGEPSAVRLASSPTWIGGNKHALLSNLVLLFYESSQIRAASVVAVLLMICMLVGVVIALRVVDVRRLGVER